MGGGQPPSSSPPGFTSEARQLFTKLNPLPASTTTPTPKASSSTKSCPTAKPSTTRHGQANKGGIRNKVTIVPATAPSIHHSACDERWVLKAQHQQTELQLGNEIIGCGPLTRCTVVTMAIRRPPTDGASRMFLEPLCQTGFAVFVATCQ